MMRGVDFVDVGLGLGLDLGWTDGHGFVHTPTPHAPTVQAMPYWIDDPSLRESIVASGSKKILEDEAGTVREESFVRCCAHVFGFVCGCMYMHGEREKKSHVFMCLYMYGCGVYV